MGLPKQNRYIEAKNEMNLKRKNQQLYKTSPQRKSFKKKKASERTTQDLRNNNNNNKLSDIYITEEPEEEEDRQTGVKRNIFITSTLRITKLMMKDIKPSLKNLYKPKQQKCNVPLL